MKIVCISDTHGRHLDMPLPDGDVIIHAGDFCSHGSHYDCVRFFGWFGSLPYEHKICIAGNHDLWMERASQPELDSIIPPSVRYLNDSGTAIDGINFWGSPVQPRFYNWAFNRDRGEDIKKHWDRIPYDTDVLITHGPAHGYCDTVYRVEPSGMMAENTGCVDLRATIENIQPHAHIFGHIHCGYGMECSESTVFLNCSVCDESYRAINRPFVLDLNPDGSVFGAYESL